MEKLLTGLKYVLKNDHTYTHVRNPTCQCRTESQFLQFLMRVSSPYYRFGFNQIIGARSILQTLWPVFTCYEHPSALSSSWRLSSTELSMDYLSDQLQYIADLPTRRRGRLRSSTSNLLDVRPSRCVTLGDRSFATAGPRLWNSLPADVRSASSLTTFRLKLKTHLLRQSYPDIVL